MPLPKPSEKESEKEFISRCMIFQDKDGKYNLKNEDERKQALAICYSQWRGKSENIIVKSFSDILTENK